MDGEPGDNDRTRPLRPGSTCLRGGAPTLGASGLLVDLAGRLSNSSGDLEALADLGHQAGSRAEDAGRRLVQLESAVVDELVARFGAGESAASLAAELGVHRTTVLRHLRKRGVETGHTKLSDAEVDEIVGRYVGGETCREIADDFGVHKDTVRRRLVGRGVVMRDGRFGA